MIDRRFLRPLLARATPGSEAPRMSGDVSAPGRHSSCSCLRSNNNNTNERSQGTRSGPREPDASFPPPGFTGF